VDVIFDNDQAIQKINSKKIKKYQFGIVIEKCINEEAPNLSLLT
jgi:hypothetical protein